MLIKKDIAIPINLYIKRVMGFIINLIFVKNYLFKIYAFIDEFVRRLNVISMVLRISVNDSLLYSPVKLPYGLM